MPCILGPWGLRGARPGQHPLWPTRAPPTGGAGSCRMGTRGAQPRQSTDRLCSADRRSRPSLAKAPPASAPAPLPDPVASSRDGRGEDRVDCSTLALPEVPGHPSGLPAVSPGFLAVRRSGPCPRADRGWARLLLTRSVRSGRGARRRPPCPVRPTPTRADSPAAARSHLLPGKEQDAGRLPWKLGPGQTPGPPHGHHRGSPGVPWDPRTSPAAHASV